MQRWKERDGTPSDEFVRISGGNDFDINYHNCWIRNNEELRYLGGNHRCQTNVYDIATNSTFNTNRCVHDDIVWSPKLPITPDILCLILSKLNMSSSIDANVWAACLLMFFGLLRKVTPKVLSVARKKCQSGNVR